MAEWLKAAVLKTVECQSSVGSNPTPSAICKSGEMAELAEGARLLSECGMKIPPRVRIPLSPPISNEQPGTSNQERATSNSLSLALHSTLRHVKILLNIETGGARLVRLGPVLAAFNIRLKWHLEVPDSFHDLFYKAFYCVKFIRRHLKNKFIVY